MSFRFQEFFVQGAQYTSSPQPQHFCSTAWSPGSGCVTQSETCPWAALPWVPWWIGQYFSWVPLPPGALPLWSPFLHPVLSRVSNLHCDMAVPSYGLSLSIYHQCYAQYISHFLLCLGVCFLEKFNGHGGWTAFIWKGDRHPELMCVLICPLVCYNSVWWKKKMMVLLSVTNSCWFMFTSLGLIPHLVSYSFIPSKVLKAQVPLEQLWNLRMCLWQKCWMGCDHRFLLNPNHFVESHSLLQLQIWPGKAHLGRSVLDIHKHRCTSYEPSATATQELSEDVTLNLGQLLGDTDVTSHRKQGNVLWEEAWKEGKRLGFW